MWKMRSWIPLAAASFTLLSVASVHGRAQAPGAQSAATSDKGVRPTLRLPDGKVDFGGRGAWAPIWVQDWADKKYVTQSVDVPFKPEGLALYEERRANNSKDDPGGYCLPGGVPRDTGTPYPFQLIQMPGRVVILYEGQAHMYRVILMDAKHSIDPDPSWLGESIGWWEGNDTLIVDTVGFNGRTWLDYVGHPSSDRLHVVEKFRRPDFGTLWDSIVRGHYRRPEELHQALDDQFQSEMGARLGAQGVCLSREQ